MSATHKAQSIVSAGVLHMAIDLGVKSWTLAFAVSEFHNPRIRKIDGGDYFTLLKEIRLAKARFDLPVDAPVVSCYEAGYHGFEPHRRLVELGLENLVVDSSSIEVNRRAKKVKTDRVDAAKLVGMLARWRQGASRVWRVVNVPSVDDEDLRQPQRERIALTKERTGHVNRIKSLARLAGFGVCVDRTLPDQLASFRQNRVNPLPPHLYERLLREYERWRLVDDQISQLDAQRVKGVWTEKSSQAEKVRRLLDLRGVGLNGACLLVYEVFGWRKIKNRRQLAGLAGLTPTPYSSGDSDHEQGISKAGNRWLRAIMIELAWAWLRYQPTSALSQWYFRRFAGGSSRLRRIGIVAMSRKLLVALWKYSEFGEVPEGAELVEWETKLAKRYRKPA